MAGVFAAAAEKRPVRAAADLRKFSADFRNRTTLGESVSVYMSHARERGSPAFFHDGVCVSARL